MQRVLLLLSVGAALAGCAPDSAPPTAGPTQSLSTPAGQDPAPTSPALSEPLATAVSPLPPGAEAVARTYATASLSSGVDAETRAFVDEVAPICTSAWLAALRAGEAPREANAWAGGGADRGASVVTVLGVHAARTAGPGRRAVVAARIDIVAPSPVHRAAVITLDLVEEADAWRVGFAS